MQIEKPLPHILDPSADVDKAQLPTFISLQNLMCTRHVKQQGRSHTFLEKLRNSIIPYMPTKK